MTVTITSLAATNGGEEISVIFEILSDDGACKQKQSMLISSNQYLVLGLSKGECDTDTFDAVSYAAKVWAAVKKAITLLGYGACSEKALRSKLIAKGFDKQIAAEAVAHIVSKGLICAEDDAAREAQRLAAKLWGQRRISAALYEKGYSADAVSAAMYFLEDEGVDFTESCRLLIQKRYERIPSSPAERKKMTAALQRYGYSLTEIKNAILTLQKS